MRGSNIGTTPSIAKRDSLSRLSFTLNVFPKRRRGNLRRADQLRHRARRREVEARQIARPGRQDRHSRPARRKWRLSSCGQAQEAFRSGLDGTPCPTELPSLVGRRGRSGAKAGGTHNNPVPAVPDEPVVSLRHFWQGSRLAQEEDACFPFVDECPRQRRANGTFGSKPAKQRFCPRLVGQMRCSSRDG